MADTIVNVPDASGSGDAGWLVALVVILVVIVGGVMWYRYGYFAPTPSSGTNINVTIPAPGTNSGAVITY
ncbi:MAG: hypothetical protein Q7S75_01190 [bacterium]|nr:hypothetical protein [bacterium]